MKPLTKFIGAALAVAGLSLTLLIHRFELAHSVAARSRIPSAQTTDNDSDAAAKTQVVQAYGKLPMAFEANTGQTDERVKFMARGAGYSLFLTPTESVFVLSRRQSQPPEDCDPHSMPAGPAQMTHASVAAKIVLSEPAVLRMKLVGANAQAAVEGVDEMESRVNYFIGQRSLKVAYGNFDL